eukprot:scaffold40705_cov18-Tisochrysis_lutea.AAC.5
MVCVREAKPGMSRGGDCACLPAGAAAVPAACCSMVCVREAMPGMLRGGECELRGGDLEGWRSARCVVAKRKSARCVVVKWRRVQRAAVSQRDGWSEAASNVEGGRMRETLRAVCALGVVWGRAGCVPLAGLRTGAVAGCPGAVAVYHGEGVAAYQGAGLEGVAEHHGEGLAQALVSVAAAAAAGARLGVARSVPRGAGGAVVVGGAAGDAPVAVVGAAAGAAVVGRPGAKEGAATSCPSAQMPVPAWCRRSKSQWRTEERLREGLRGLPCHHSASPQHLQEGHSSALPHYQQRRWLLCAGGPQQREQGVHVARQNRCSLQQREQG